MAPPAYSRWIARTPKPRETKRNRRRTAASTYTASPGQLPLVADLVESLIGIPGAVAVMRAARGDAAAPPPPGGGPAYLLYYRATLEAADLRELAFEGDAAEPGAWGRRMNGGASLTVEGRRVEVIYRQRAGPAPGGPRILRSRLGRSPQPGALGLWPWPPGSRPSAPASGV